MKTKTLQLGRNRNLIEKIVLISLIVFILLYNVSAETLTINRTIIILIDGSRADGVYNNINSGFSTIINHSIKFDKSNTVFPSITPAAHSSIFVGNYPSEHGVMGFRWFDNLKHRKNI